MYGTEQLMEENFIPTCSVVFRRAHLPVLPEELRVVKIGDWPLWVFISRNGGIMFIEEPMAHYRVHGRGAWSSLSPLGQLEGIKDLFEVFLRHLDRRLKPACRKKLAELYYDIAIIHSKRSQKLSTY